MNRLFYIFIVAVLAFVQSSCIHDDVPEKADVVRVGDRLPDFSVTMNDGTVVTGAALREKLSVVVFFHTSCPDCQQLLPQLQPLYDEYSAKNVAFALIAREEGEEPISAFWRAHNLTMPYSPQRDRAIYALFAKSLIPRVYVSDERGEVQRIFSDNPLPSYEEIKAAIDKLL